MEESKLHDDCHNCIKPDCKLRGRWRFGEAFGMMRCNDWQGKA